MSRDRWFVCDFSNLTQYVMIKNRKGAFVIAISVKSTTLKLVLQSTQTCTNQFSDSLKNARPFYLGNWFECKMVHQDALKLAFGRFDI